MKSSLTPPYWLRAMKQQRLIIHLLRRVYPYASHMRNVLDLCRVWVPLWFDYKINNSFWKESKCGGIIWLAVFVHVDSHSRSVRFSNSLAQVPLCREGHEGKCRVYFESTILDHKSRTKWSGCLFCNKLICLKPNSCQWTPMLPWTVLAQKC